MYEQKQREQRHNSKMDATMELHFRWSVLRPGRANLLERAPFGEALNELLDFVAPPFEDRPMIPRWAFSTAPTISKRLELTRLWFAFSRDAATRGLAWARREHSKEAWEHRLDQADYCHWAEGSLRWRAPASFALALGELRVLLTGLLLAYVDARMAASSIGGFASWPDKGVLGSSQWLHLVSLGFYCVTPGGSFLADLGAHGTISPRVA